MLHEAVGIMNPQAGRPACGIGGGTSWTTLTEANKPDQADGDPRPAAVTFVTTEHFTLVSARSSTISESTGRASVFLGAVSGGLVALGLVATAVKTGVAGWPSERPRDDAQDCPRFPVERGVAPRLAGGRVGRV
jgi:hypothetical protein